MGYRWVEHTAEVELEIEAPTEEAAFNEAAHALGELVGDDLRQEWISREVSVAADDRAVLLAHWLDELVYLAETEDLVPDEVERIELSGHGLRAIVRCRRGNPRPLVRGVTYHQLSFERADHGFRATVVLDV